MAFVDSDSITFDQEEEAATGSAIPVYSGIPAKPYQGAEAAGGFASAESIQFDDDGPSVGDHVRSDSNAMARGALRLPGDVLKTVAVLGTGATNLLTGGERKASDDLLYRAGDAITEGLESFFPSDERLKGSFEDQVAQGLGQFGGQVILAGATGGGATLATQAAKSAIPAASKVAGVQATKQAATSIGIGVGMGGSEAYEDAVRSGADELTAQRVGAWGSLIGTSEALPIQKMFGILGKHAPKAAERLIDIGIEALEEGGQEAFQQTASNYIAQLNYDEQRSLWNGVAESASVGGTVGAIAATVAQLFIGRRGGHMVIDRDQANHDITGNAVKDLRSDDMSRTGTDGREERWTPDRIERAEMLRQARSEGRGVNAVEAEVVPEQAIPLGLPAPTEERLALPAPEQINLPGPIAMPGPNAYDPRGAYDEKQAPVSAIDLAAHEAATSPLNDRPEPTEKQIEAGVYKKGHVKVHGLDVSIENPKGSLRKGTSPDGTTWETEMQSHYGYIKGTVGKDKDHLDIFLTPEAESADRVFVVDQIDPETGSFDEHKLVMGPATEEEARSSYLANYDETGQERIGAITEMPMDEFKAWVKSGKTTKPLSYQEPKPDLPGAGAETQPPETGEVPAPAAQNTDLNTDTTDSTDSVAESADLGTPDKVNTVALSGRFKSDLLSSGKKLDKMNVKQFVAKELGVKVKDLNEDTGRYDHKAVEEAMEYALVQKAREITTSTRSPEEKFEAVKALYQGQPNLSSRDSNSMKAQQYSTPLPLAYLMQDHVGMEGEIYEPTAGNGALVFTADPDSVHVNELDQGPRLAHLQDSGFGQVSSQDALEGPAAPKSKDRVLMNPPFGTAAEPVYLDGFKLSKLEHQIVAKGLDAMKDDGKAAFIIGGHNFNDKGKMTETDRLFFNWLYSRYNVGHNIDVSGDVYRRQGTSFPIRIVTVNGRKAEPDTTYAPAQDQIGKAKDFDQVRDLLKGGGNVESKQPGGRTVPTGAGVAESGSGLSGAKDGQPSGGPRPVRRPKSQPAGDRERDSGGSREAVGEAADGGKRAGSPESGPGKDAGGSSDRGADVEQEDTGTYGNSNKVFTKDKAERAREILRKKLNSQLNTGLDPEMVQAGIDLAGYHVEAGARKFADYAKRMVADLGAGVRPHLKSWYMAVRYHPSMNAEGMSTAAEVEAFDVNAAEEQKEERKEPEAENREDKGKEAKEEKTEAPPKKKTEKRDTDALQAPYTPRSGNRSGGNLTPRNMADAAVRALDHLEEKHGNIDHFVAEQLGYADRKALYKHLSAEQIDAVALAIDNIESGQGMIVGDQTGVGKGRTAAAIIRYANRRGKRPIFVTKDAKLFTDMWRDLTDIDHSAIKPFLMHSDTKGNIVDEDGEVIHARSGSQKVFREMLQDPTGYMERHGYDALMVPYTQLQKTGNSQQQILSELAKDNIVIMDEAHEAAGDSARGQFIRSMLAEAQGALYLSATYAKRPDNMPLYFRTALGTSGMSGELLVDVMTRGGVPLQQAIAAQLAEAGQYIRREMDFSGIDIGINVDATNSARDSQRADDVTTLLRRIIEFDIEKLNTLERMDAEAKREGRDITGDSNTAAGVTQSNFSSRVHNLVGQLLLGLKADAVAGQAIAALKRGEKPLVNLMNTMESFLDFAVEELGVQVGDPIGASFKDVLYKALDSTLYYTEKDAYGNKERKKLEIEELSDGAQDLYHEILDEIDSADVDLPASPIDYLKGKIEAEGHTVGEITGRQLTIDYSGDVPTLARRTTKEIKDRNTPVNKFNSGELDVMIFNTAGSTGISLHASEKFKDRRPRHMIVAQADLNIDTFIQALGRIFRKGQVENPRYTIQQTALPAEIRPAVVLQKKMNSLNANTSANAESSTSLKNVPDMMNHHGDKIVTEYLEANPDIAQILNVSPGEDDAMKKTSGRMALMPVEIQKAFYAEIEQEYKDLIEYLDQIGENDLVAKDFDYQAQTIEKTPIHEGIDESNPFAASAYVEDVSVNILKKPLTAAKVQELIDATLDELAPEVFNQGILDELNDKAEEFRKKTIDEKGEEKAAAIIERTIDRPMQTITANLHDKFFVGATYDLSLSDDYSVTGVLTDIRIKKAGEGANPVAASRVELQFALADPTQRVSVPMSRGMILKATTLKNYRFDHNEWSKITPDRAKERRQIVTGNLLYGLQQTNGQIIHYTTEDGSLKQGLLVPRSKQEKGDLGKHIFVGHQDGHRYLLTQFGSSQVNVLPTNIPDVALTYDHGRQIASLRTPANKQAEAKYWPEKLIQLTTQGKFTRNRGRSVGHFQGGNILSAVRLLEEELGMRFKVSTEFKGVSPKKQDKKEEVDAAPKKQEAQQTETASIPGVKVEANHEYGGVEISFPSRPGEEVLDQLRGAGFRWHRAKKLWYAQTSPERKAIAERLSGQGSDLPVPADSGMVLYSGIPVDALIKEVRALAGKTREAWPKLVDLGQRALELGHGTLDSFTNKMKGWLGDAYSSFRGVMLKVYQDAKKRLTDERGSFSTADTAIEEAAGRLDEKKIRGMIGALARLGEKAHSIPSKVLPEAVKDGIASVLATPLFQAERNPEMKPFILEQINRQEESSRVGAEFREFRRDGKRATLGELQAELKSLTKTQQRMVERLIIEGDINRIEYGTLEEARKNPKLKDIDQAALDHYLDMREFIRTLSGKVRRQMMENSLEKYAYMGERFTETLRAMLTRQADMSEVDVTDKLWKAYTDIQGLKLILPEYQNKPWWKDLVGMIKDEGARAEWQAIVKDKNIDADLRRAFRKVMENKMVERQVKRAAKNLVETRKTIRDMKQKFGHVVGWFPRVREDGAHKIYVYAVGEDGEVNRDEPVFMQMRNTELTAENLKKKLETAEGLKELMPHNFDEEAEYVVEVERNQRLGDEIYGSLAGDMANQQLINRAMEQAKQDGADADTIDQLQDALMQETANVLLARGAGRHQLKRADHLIEGYQTESVYRILDDYIAGAAGYMTKARYSMRQMRNLTEAPPHIKDWAFRYVKDSLRNTTWGDRASGTARALTTLWYLGAKPSSALINATQNLTLGQAELSRHTKGALGKLQRSLNDVIADHVAHRQGKKSPRINSVERAALHDAIRAGLVHENIVGEMIGADEGARAKVWQGVHRATEITMRPFQMVEQVNREMAFLAAYRVFQAPGFAPSRKHPFDPKAAGKAAEFVYKVHFIPGKANLPRFARNPLGRTAYTLQTFVWNSLNWFYNRATSGDRDQVIALARSLAAIAVLGGLAAIPGGDELNELLKKLTGKDHRLAFERWMRDHAEEYGHPGEAAVNFVFHGLPSFAGINISNAIAIRFPILSNWLAGDEITESVSGPVGGMAQKAVRAADAYRHGDYYRAIENAAPEAIAGIMRAARLKEDGATTVSGKPILDENGKPTKYDPTDAAKRAIGFQPIEHSRRYGVKNSEVDLKAWWTDEKSTVAAKVRRLIRDGKKQEANRMVLRFNARLAESQAGKLVQPITGSTVSRGMKPRFDKRSAAFQRDNL